VAQAIAGGTLVFKNTPRRGGGEKKSDISGNVTPRPESTSQTALEVRRAGGKSKLIGPVLATKEAERAPT